MESHLRAFCFAARTQPPVFRPFRKYLERLLGDKRRAGRWDFGRLEVVDAVTSRKDSQESDGYLCPTSKGGVRGLEISAAGGSIVL